MIQMNDKPIHNNDNNEREQFESGLGCGRSLIQKPMFTNGDGNWSGNFLEVASKCESLTWDPAAMSAFVSFGYATGDRTMFREISCLPWMSNLTKAGNVVPQSIPEHGFHQMSADSIAQQMLVRLENEAEKACANHDRIYVLTSGGLDSRIVAGIVKRLLAQGRITAEVQAVTWGRKGSRDVEIGKAVAGKLGFDWQHLELTEKHLANNIDDCAVELGALVAPIHIHRMSWFRNIEPGGIVLAGSYGDSVGRGEFSGDTVLNLQKLQPRNRLGFLSLDAMSFGNAQLENDWTQFRLRLEGRPEYAIRECEEQGHYMRRMISQAMSIIDGPNQLYQMFTDPEVFGFMWSIHPCFRDNQPYAELLRLLGHDLARLPWARTNKPLAREDEIKIKSSVNGYHDYPNWTRTLLKQDVALPDHIEWLVETGLFDPRRVKEICNGITNLESSPASFRLATNLISWTLSLRKMVDSIGVSPPRFSLAQCENDFDSALASGRQSGRLLQQIPLLPLANRFMDRTRKIAGRQIALLRYPPSKTPSDGPIYPDN